jgi:hypothetical protein
MVGASLNRYGRGAMYWYRFELTEGQIRKGGLAGMERRFEEQVARPGICKPACLLRKWQPYNTEAVFYIYAATPLGEDALSCFFSAEPCDPPSMASVRFWSGDVGLSEALERSASLEQ